MDTTTLSTARAGSRKGRPNHPIDFKLRLAQQACEPGVSVSRLASEHGIDANQAAARHATALPYVGCSAAGHALPVR